MTVSCLIPADCEVLIPHGNKAVTALSFDLQGTKFATGCYAYTVNYYEFLKMDSSMKFFRQVYPCEWFNCCLFLYISNIFLVT